jgi:hypothetical protein
MYPSDSSSPSSLFAHFRAYGWLGAATGLLLLIPALAMRFTTEVNWSLADFLAMGLLLFGVSSTGVFVGRKLSPRHRWLLGGALFLAFLYLWAELAIGVFSKLGS